MITLDNYQDKKDSIDWKQMPAEINSVKTDIEGMMEFYDEDSDIKDAVDLFLKGVNKNSKKEINPFETLKIGQSFVISKTITLVEENTTERYVPKEPITFTGKGSQEYKLFKDSSGTIFSIGNTEFSNLMREKIFVLIDKPNIKEIADNSNGRINIVKVAPSSKKVQTYIPQKNDEFELIVDKKLKQKDSYNEYRIVSGDFTFLGIENEEAANKGDYKISRGGSVFWITVSQFNELFAKNDIVLTLKAKTSVSNPKLYVIYKDGKFLYRQRINADYSFTDNENFAYEWPEHDLKAAKQLASHYVAKVLTMAEALELKEKIVSNKGETLQDAFLKSKLVRAFMPKAQQMAVLENDESKEVQFFIDKIKELEANFVKSTKHDPKNRVVDAVAHAHYFYGDTHWYLCELEEKRNEFFGYVILNGDTQNSEAGYSSWDEMKTIKGIELDFYFKPQELGKILHKKYPDDFDKYEVVDNEKAAQDKTAKPIAKAAPKAKVAKVLIEKKIINITPEFLLIKRFWNIIKNEKIVIPFRTTQLLNMAFNKAAVERKVRKTSEAASLFIECQKKINVLFLEFAAPTQADVKIEFSDKKLYAEIQEYVTKSTVNPAVPVLNRFIAMQNTLPEVKKAETLLKAIVKVSDNDKNNRLSSELNQAKVALEKYIAKPKTSIEPKVYGLSVPRSVCTNRVKCAGIDKTGKLHKGYKFQEHTGNVVRVRKTKGRLASPRVCENRVKCTGLSKTGKLLKGYKFEEGTNHVVKVGNTKKRKSTSKKKLVAGLGYSDRLEFQDVERIYVSNPTISIINQPLKLEEEEKINVPQVSNTNAAVIENKKESSPKNKLMQMQFDSLDLDQGWEKFMQNPAKNMKVAIWGKPKNGKTAGSLQLADYLSKFGKVLYNFADQGFNKSTQDLWKMSGLANNENAEPSDVQTLDALEKEIATGKYTFVFIDMISDYINKENIKPYEFKERFMKKYPNVSFILIFEVTKGGDFKGDQGWTHIVDAIVTVEDFLMENRGRYGVGSHIVWDDGFKKFNPKRYDEVTAELAPEIELSFSEEVERI